MKNSENNGKKEIGLDFSTHFLSYMEEDDHPGLILGLRPANERRRYFVTTSLIGWAQA